MKRILSLLLIFAMVLGTASCTYVIVGSPEGEESSVSEQESSSTEEEVRVYYGQPEGGLSDGFTLSIDEWNVGCFAYHTGETQFDADNVEVTVYFGTDKNESNPYEQAKDSILVSMGVFCMNGEEFYAQYPFERNAKLIWQLHSSPLGLTEDYLCVYRKMDDKSYYTGEYDCKMKDSQLSFTHKEKIKIPAELFSGDEGIIILGFWEIVWRSSGKTEDGEDIFNGDSEYSLLGLREYQICYTKDGNKISIEKYR